MESLKCPECSAPLERPAPGTQTLSCPYCNNSFLLSRAVAGPQTPVQAWVPPTPPKRNLTFIGWFIAGIVAVVVGFPVVMSLLVFGVHQHVKNTTFTPITPMPVMPSVKFPTIATLPAASEFGKLVTKFGAKGVGPGQFLDIRSVAVDGKGRIYVGEAFGGRIQAFDADGKFLRVWNLESKNLLRNLAATRDGTVLAILSGQVLRYDGATGKPLNRLEVLDARGQQVYFSDVACAIDGRLFALDQESSVWILDADSKTLKTIDLKKATQDEDVKLERIAVSGDGRFYALDPQRGIYQFDPNGKFVNRFAMSDENDPASRREDVIHMAGGIAIDGQGRVIVADLNPALKVFDRSGRFLGSIAPYQVCFGVAVNDADQIVGCFRNDCEIRKYEINHK